MKSKKSLKKLTAGCCELKGQQAVLQQYTFCKDQEIFSHRLLAVAKIHTKLHVSSLVNTLVRRTPIPEVTGVPAPAVKSQQLQREKQ